MSKKICEFFLKGNCKFGAKCRFLHPQNIQSNQMQMPMQIQGPNPQSHIHQKNSVCTFFLKNSCTRPNCPFFHGYGNFLQHVKVLKNEREINNLINVNGNEFIACDEQAFIVRFADNDKEVKESLNKEGYKIGKMIYSGNKIIFALSKEGM
jgi:hypothetical protein